MSEKYFLLVDDDEDIIEAIVRSIVVEGGEEYSPLVATDGYDALEFMKTKPVALVLLDIRMRNLDGFHVCRQAAGDTTMSAIPIVVSSGFLSEEDKKELRSLGIKYFLDKPYTMTQLWAMIHAVFRSNR